MGRTAHRISIVCLGPPSPLVQQALCKLVDELGVPGETAGARSAKGPLPMTSAPFAVLGFSGGVCSPFDAESYFHCHADVRGGGVADAGAALMHFVRHGLAAGYSWHGPEAPAFEHLVIHCEVAEAELMAQWRRAGAHIIAVLDDPVAAARHLVACGVSVRDAVARIAHSFSSLHDLVVDGVVPLVSRADGEGEARAGLAHALEPGAVASRRTGEPNVAVGPFAERGGVDDDDGLEALLGDYRPLLAGRPVTVVNWPAQVFHRPDAVEGEAGAEIDMTGPARALAVGPYFSVPPGSWSCRAEFSVADNHGGCSFVVDVYQLGAVNRALAEHAFTLPEQGTYALRLAFETEDPHAPVENRFQLREGLIGGRFQVHGSRLSRVT